MASNHNVRERNGGKSIREKILFYHLVQSENESNEVKYSTWILIHRFFNIAFVPTG